ncbi:hypothetical protein K5E40_03655 [Pseudomonas baetica]|uniref:hypothetical protein n=1 Tax=Pseudomonas baetica TaxID=674054 RepID=UPI001C8C9B0D|nr:hypothetical protein [Pseudomonas baetica]MBX9404770.1 hypothetical protein [Pseudomonas baetica]
MSGIKKFRADYRHVVETEFDDAQYVGIADFDAQRLRADTAEIDRDTYAMVAQACADDCSRLKHKLDAAEQIITELRELLRLMTNDYACCLEAGHDRITFLGGDCDSVSKMLDDNVNYAKSIAALNPNPEAESHE